MVEGGTTEWTMSRININILDRYHFRWSDFARTQPRHNNISGFSECIVGRDNLEPAMEDVRRAVLSPDDLLDYKLFSYAPTSCCIMPSDINVNLTQGYSINHYQESTRASSVESCSKSLLITVHSECGFGRTFVINLCQSSVVVSIQSTEMILDDILENGETRRLDPELISSASIIRNSEILTGHILVVSTVQLPRF
jgi:hypothetical protein